MRRILILLLLAGLPLASARAQTLYEALGGQPVLERIIGRALDAASADPRIADKFDNINLARLKTRVAAHICLLAGGPCAFKGVSMAGAHGYLQLTQYHFNALVEDLQDAMDAEAIPFRIQNQLLAVLAPLERQIVTR